MTREFLPCLPPLEKSWNLDASVVILTLPRVEAQIFDFFFILLLSIHLYSHLEWTHRCL